MVIHFYTVVLARLTGLLCFQLDFRKPIRGVAGWCARATHQAGGCGGDDPRGPRPCQGWPVTDEKQTLGFSKPNPSGIWLLGSEIEKRSLSDGINKHYHLIFHLFASFCPIEMAVDWGPNSLPSQASCGAGEFFVWRRDEAGKMTEISKEINPDITDITYVGVSIDGGTPGTPKWMVYNGKFFRWVGAG